MIILDRNPIRIKTENGSLGNYLDMDTETFAG